MSDFTWHRVSRNSSKRHIHTLSEVNANTTRCAEVFTGGKNTGRSRSLALYLAGSAPADKGALLASLAAVGGRNESTETSAARSEETNDIGSAPNAAASPNAGAGAGETGETGDIKDA